MKVDSEEAKFKAIRSCRYSDLRASLNVNIDALYLILNKREVERENELQAERLERTQAILNGIIDLLPHQK